MFDGLTPPYRTIVADPPWKYGAWGKPSNMRFAKSAHLTFDLPYDTMTLTEIKNLPVGDLAAEDCELYLWTTQKYLPVAFGVMSAWGFRYCQTLVWCKRPRGLGQGGVYVPTTEFALLGRRGKMPAVRRQDSTWFLWTRPNNAHSKKPDEFFDLIEQTTTTPRVELFARTPRLGWDGWGDQYA